MPIWLWLIVLYAYSISGCAASLNESISFCATEAVSNKPIRPDSRWGNLACEKEISVVAALDEYEPASVVIRSNESRILTISISDLASSDSVFSKNNIDIKYVKNWYQSETAWHDIRQKNKRSVLVPELLLNDESIIYVDDERIKNYLKVSEAGEYSYKDISSKTNIALKTQPTIKELPVVDAKSLQPLKIKKNTNQQVWLTFKIPVETLPGDYRGDLIIDSTEGELRVPVLLSVRPYKLMPAELSYSIYYRGVLAVDDIGTISSENKSKQQMLQDFINMKAHGVENPTIYQPYWDVKGFEAVMELRSKAGFQSKDLYFLGITTGNYGDDRDVEKRLKAFDKIRKIADRYEIETLYIYGIDEADPDKIEGQYPLWKKFNDKGAKIFVAAWRPDREELLGGKIDLLVNGVRHNNDMNKAFNLKGTKVYLYNRPQVGVENPLIYRNSYGFELWGNGFQGAMNYAYQHSFGNIWNDFDHKEFRDHVFAYPAVDKPIDTIAWEGFREGVDDIRYVSTLRHSIATYHDQGSIKIKEAKDFLLKLKRESSLSAKEKRAAIDKHIISLCCNGFEI